MGDQHRFYPLPHVLHITSNTMSFCKLRRIRSEADLAEVELAAKADAHRVVGATHLILQEDRVVGYVSLGGIPLMNVWVDKDRVKVRDSLGLMQAAEAILAEHHGAVMTPCMESSPFHKLMPGLGYETLGTTTMFVKRL